MKLNRRIRAMRARNLRNLQNRRIEEGLLKLQETNVGAYAQAVRNLAEVDRLNRNASLSNFMTSLGHEFQVDGNGLWVPAKY